MIFLRMISSLKNQSVVAVYISVSNNILLEKEKFEGELPFSSVKVFLSPDVICPEKR